MIIVLLALLGVALGSFVNALVWRVYQQSKQKKRAKNTDYSITKGRSMCPRCKHVLRAADLVPVLSWIFLKGRCRYCKKSISWQYPLVELACSALFVISYIYWPLQLSGGASYVLLGLWLVIVTIGLALFVYDFKWMLLPNTMVYPFIALSILFSILRFAIYEGSVLDLTLAPLVYWVFFYTLYQISKGKWIGGGDVRLVFGLGSLLGLAGSLLGLTLAAYLGTFVIVILYVMGRYHKKMKLPFGPFLLSATFVTFMWGQYVIDWYLRISGMK
jgi:leader peptidase (prepilin peptidase)/N-methyltransferase